MTAGILVYGTHAIAYAVEAAFDTSLTTPQMR